MFPVERFQEEPYIETYPKQDIDNGYKATEAIRRLTDPEKAGIPIVAMTANTFEEDKKMALSKGMNAHIAKPIDVAKVEEVLFSILQNRK